MRDGLKKKSSSGVFGTGTRCSISKSDPMSVLLDAAGAKHWTQEAEAMMASPNHRDKRRTGTGRVARRHTRTRNASRRRMGSGQRHTFGVVVVQCEELAVVLFGRDPGEHIWKAHDRGWSSTSTAHMSPPDSVGTRALGAVRDTRFAVPALPRAVVRRHCHGGIRGTH